MKHQNLQPWLDYFQMLQTYQLKGFLEVHADKGEAYITQPALHAMTEGSDPEEQLKSGAIFETARRIRTYAAWLDAWKAARGAARGEEYLRQLFAVHVVEDKHPHDLIYTILLTQERKWWCPWKLTECVEVVTYEG